MGCGHEPYALFSLFFTDKIFAELAANTNKYAEGKIKPKSRVGGKKTRQQGKSVFERRGQQSRKWVPTLAGELKVWFGLTIKMGLHREPSIALHWSKEASNGWWKTSLRPVLRQLYLSSPRQYKIPENCISLIRYQQIKRYFHISDPIVELDQKHWYGKLNLLANQLQESFQ